MTGLTTSPADVMVPEEMAAATSIRSDIEKRSLTDFKKKSKTSSDFSMAMALQEGDNLISKPELLLHEAARTNNVEVVKRLLAAKVNINSANNIDRTPLQWAAANGSKEVIRVLLEHGADLEATDKYGMRPLLWACWFGHVDAVKFLVACGADTTCVNKQGYGMLHCAVHQNQCEVTSFIFEQLENYDLSHADRQGRTAVHLASREGHEQALSLLLSKASNIDAKEKSGKNAVHLASGNGHLACIERLLEVGLEIDDRDEDGRTALHLAAENNHSLVCEYLLKYNADMNAETIKETTALHIAASQGHSQVVTILLSHGADSNARDFQGNSALHLAAMGGYRDICKDLLASGATIDVRNNRLQTPLHAAVEKGNSETVEELLHNGANTEARENCGRSPLYMAARGSFTDIVDMIIKNERSSEKTNNSAENTQNIDNPHFSYMKPILEKLANKHLNENDWKKLAVYWKFNESHIRAIQHQFNGDNSHKDHGYRMLLIWLYGLDEDSSPLDELYEALVKIGRKNVADHIRRKLEMANAVDKSRKPNCRIN